MAVCTLKREENDFTPQGIMEKCCSTYPTKVSVINKNELTAPCDDNVIVYDAQLTATLAVNHQQSSTNLQNKQVLKNNYRKFLEEKYRRVKSGQRNLFLKKYFLPTYSIRKNKEKHSFPYGSISKPFPESIYKGSPVTCSKSNFTTDSENIAPSYGCEFCSTTFTQIKDLREHVKGIHGKAKVSHLCSFCSKKFAKRFTLLSHLRHHADGQHFCIKCGFMCKEESVYANHMNKHYASAKYACTHCEQKFTRRQQRDQHVLGHSRYSCGVCSATFSTRKLLREHGRNAHGVTTISSRKHECPTCGKLFLRPIHLIEHVRSHTGEKPVRCSQCDKSFVSEHSLLKHVQTAAHLQRIGSKVEKPFLCAECGSRFFYHESLQRHIGIVHSAGEKFNCKQCNYSTKCKANLKRHADLHTKERRFVCEQCGASFRTLATLHDHYAYVHSDERSFVCEECGKGFKNKSGLQRHLRVHSEVRPYQCHCGRDYKRLSHLKRHMVSAHGNNSVSLSQSSLAIEGTIDELNKASEDVVLPTTITVNTVTQNSVPVICTDNNTCIIVPFEKARSPSRDMLLLETPPSTWPSPTDNQTHSEVNNLDIPTYELPPSLLSLDVQASLLNSLGRDADLNAPSRPQSAPNILFDTTSMESFLQSDGAVAKNLFGDIFPLSPYPSDFDTYNSADLWGVNDSPPNVLLSTHDLSNSLSENLLGYNLCGEDNFNLEFTLS